MQQQPQQSQQQSPQRQTLEREEPARRRAGGGGIAFTASPLPPPQPGDDVARARTLVLTYGWNSVCWQILNPGFEYWFSARGDAVVGYRRDSRSRVRVVGGSPVCAGERLAEVVAEWEADADAAGDSVCYLCAAGRMLGLFRPSRPGAISFGPHAIVALGAQPVWNPARWQEILASQSSLRQQVNRAKNKGVAVEEWDAARAGDSSEVRQCLEGWLAARPLPPLRFLAEPHTLDRLEGRRIFVAVHRPKGAPRSAPGGVVGFLVASPIPRRGGWLFEQIIRCQGAPNGVAEALIDTAMRAVAAEGSRYVTLGLSPLSRHGPESVRLRNPLWLRLTQAWARAHGRRFWNFDGLDAFKSKFHPDAWEPIFAISCEARFTPGVLFALARAFSSEAERLSAVQAAGRIVADAARQEWHWLRERALRRPPGGGKPPGHPGINASV